MPKWKLTAGRGSVLEVVETGGEGMGGAVPGDPGFSPGAVRDLADHEVRHGQQMLGL